MHADSPPLPGRRELKRRQTRLALITAALRLTEERGADRVTTDEISAAAEVSPRTFFNYFATKEDALVGDPLEDCGAPVLPADRPLLDALLTALAPAFEQIQHDRELWLLRMRVIAANPQLLPLLIAAAASAEHRLATAIATHSGLDPDHPRPAVVAAVANAAVRVALIRWAESGDARPLIEHVREAFAILHDLRESR
ncbi:TetR family transcriptional regulator [Actinoplanes philippinensis]|uniref:DNA-binding transcriptional regulator, AcrR family n=1 Tax=Actinoplanes philippinensis TaxID=35752 RepID=A0A1I2J4N0_9ACTN|nr:TetR/AcrR family transcriptional regulator [Actinoplanes philippinensis]GIE79702.1 TetR family transcriptional regulator [Actinoplanes philippinensis]SFF48187.1 DNA-binding transcriptional regulator, AcrR family [Actinoplanes philippinensis]